jgi:hypothetical protein
VRRVKDARHRDALFPVWRHQPFFTNSDEPLTDADITAATGPWKTVEDVELAIPGWYRHNTSRLHSYLGDIPPAEFEATFYDDHGPINPWSASNSPSLRQNQGVSSRI